MHEQARLGLEQILVEAEVLVPIEEPDGSVALALDLTFKIDAEIAWRCVRAAYSRGYEDSLSDEHPFPTVEASAYEREAWARLPA